MIKYNICSYCVMDTTDPDIKIYTDGCNYCKHYRETIPLLPKFSENKDQLLDALVKKIKKSSKGKEYDCVIGVSGGVDSSYVAYLVKEKLGLNPLAVHMDNGWNDELAVHNIEKTLRQLNIDLWTEVLDWDEFSSLQVAFLKSGTPDCEIPTDHAIVASLYNAAKKFGIKYILTGNNLITESIMPHAWSRGHSDWMYISDINKKYGTKKLKRLPHFNLLQRWWREKYSSIKKERILSYVEFDKKEAAQLLMNKFGWQAYSGKHHESIYTKFYQAFWLMKKFGFDKRKGHLSALICAGQVTRDEALKELQTPPISEKVTVELKEYVADKFNMSVEELEKIMLMPNKSFFDFSSQQHCWQYSFVRSIYRKTLKPIYLRVI